MTETVKKSVYTALNKVERELKQVGTEHAVNALNQVVNIAYDSVFALR
ncbi:TPA: hypothetical protein ACPZ1L_005502 [Klebsiella pneumoniae]